MAEHKATISWKGGSGDFLKGQFSRQHTWTFDGGLSVTASAAPSVVPPPLSNPEGVDPEEAFVASLSSCHMLTFLFLAYRKGLLVESYDDTAVGEMAKGDNGVPWVSRITLHPKIVFGGEKQPTREEEGQLHQQSHHYCYIANSIKTRVVVSGFDGPPAA
ncbi:MAG: OsmC family protein [Verrucomicrobia bacterium]|jgi:organic hydroperoxide reductase OsmC/OhrA|nr:OsmC family protein [Verrucomicrobiota bacterium]